MGTDAVPALIEGLTFPSGYSQKRALVCEILSRIGARDAVPALVAALRDPVLPVSEWACLALESAGDPDALPALSRYERRVLALEANPTQAADADRLLARVARTSLMLGDESARGRLVSLLHSRDRTARELAIRALEDRFGDRLGYDPDASDEDRAKAVERWMR
jgi:HEAT repeat protein